MNICASSQPLLMVAFGRFHESGPQEGKRSRNARCNRDGVDGELGIAGRHAPQSDYLLNLQSGGSEADRASLNGLGAPPATSETVAQLQHLAALHASGALSDAEFAAAKSGLIT